MQAFVGRSKAASMERTGQWQQILCLVKDAMPSQLPHLGETLQIVTFITSHVERVILRWCIDEMGNLKAHIRDNNKTCAFLLC